jgi:hypothetical protein
VAIGDVNGDGRNDVVMTTSYYTNPQNSSDIFVFLQDSSGELSSPIKYPTNSPYANRPTSIDIGDLNHDGRADVVVGNCGSNIGVFIQNASGNLLAGRYYPTVNSCSIKLADLNNDGLLDVVGIGSETYSVDVFLQNANGTLNPPTSYRVNYPCSEIEVGDVNHDGLTDIIVLRGPSYSSPNIGVLLQRADGSFDPAIYYDLGGYELAPGVAIGDVNGDNLEDVVVTYGEKWPFSTVGVLLQNTDGTLNSIISYESYNSPESVVIADMNHDGKKDVVVAHGKWEALGVYRQGTNGSLLPEELYPLPYMPHHNPQGLAVGDINGDGFNDVVLVDYNHGLTVLYNRHNTEIISVPTTPSGPNTVSVNVSHIYSTGGSVSDVGQPIQYFFDWGDGTNSGWLPIGTTNASKSWASIGIYKIKVQARCAYHPTAFSLWSESLSVAVFSFSVVSPNGEEAWTAGSTQTIRWTFGGNVGAYVKIELLKEGMLNRTLASLVSINKGSYNWKIPSNQPSAKDYQIRVTSIKNSSYTDTSDNNFTIVGAPPPAITLVSPNGGETWQVGTTQTIQWTYTGSPGTSLKIELLKADVLNRTITSFASTSKGAYSWRIPATLAAGADYSIRITSKTNPSCTDVSDADFTINK